MSDIWQQTNQFDSQRQDNLLNTGEADAEMFKSWQANAPAAIEAINRMAPVTAQSQLAAQQGVLGGYNQIGAENVGLADKYQRQLDPEYYTQRANISQALSKYLGGYDPYNLSATEMANISRGIGATGGNLMPSQQNTVRNANLFADAGIKRWQNFGDAITKAATATEGLRSGLRGFDISQTGAGSTAAKSAADNAMNANFGFSTSALGDIAGNMQARVGKSKDYWDKLKAGSPSSIFGGII